MNITVSNSTIIRSLVQKTEGENFSIGENFSAAEKILNWIMKLCSPESKAYKAANVSDETIERMEVKLFTQLIMRAETNQLGALADPIDFKIGGRDYQIYQLGDKLYCKNVSSGTESQMKDLTIGQLKTAFFADYAEKCSAKGDLGKTIASLDLTSVDTSEQRFADTEITGTQLKKIAEDGGDLRGAKLKEDERQQGTISSSNISDDTIEWAFIDKTVALQMIKAGAEPSSVIIAYTRTLVMEGKFDVDLRGFDFTPEQAAKFIEGESFSSGVNFRP